jgi:hypothetical protein
MNINKKWSTLIGSILIHITLGSLLTFGEPFIISYFFLIVCKLNLNLKVIFHLI